MTLSAQEMELIKNYRTASENDRQRISIITQEAAEVAARIEIRRGQK